jgi:hypothetical protein
MRAVNVETKEAVILPKRSKSSDGFLKLFIFTLSFLLFVYSLYLTLVFLDRNVLIQNGWSQGLMSYQALVAVVHVFGLSFLIRLLVQRRRIAIGYVKIAIVLGAIFRVIIDPLVAGVIDPVAQVPTFQLWGRVFFGLVFPFFWFQFFRKSEEVRLTLVN